MKIRLLTILFLTSCFAATANVAVAQTTFTSTPAQNIPTAGTPVTTTIDLSGQPGVITDVNVGLSVTTSFAGDLDFSVTSPTGTSVLFSDNIGGSGQFTGTIFDDEAVNTIGGGGTTSPYNGSFLPSNSLSAFDGEVIDGVWTLTATDTFAGTGGTIDAWSLIFNTPEFTEAPIPEVVIAAAAPAPAPAPAPFRNTPAPPVPVLLVDQGAIASAETTGLLIPIVNRSVTQNAASGAIRDLNGRLFRARSGGDVAPASQFTGASGGTMVRYLDFADEQGLDYDQTITIGDGVAVSVHDTMLTGGAIMAVGPDGKAVVSDPSVDPKSVVEPLAPAYAYNRFQAFSEFNYGFYDQDNLTDLVRGFQSDTYSGTVGAEFRVAPWLHIGGAFSYLESDTDLSSDYGNIDLDGTLISAYATTFYGNFYLDTLYSFGQFDNDIHRNTLLGRHATGNTESETHNVDVNLGYNVPLTRKITVGPTLGVNYATGDIDGYTETAGRNANLIYGDDDFESTIGRLGSQISYTTDTGFGKVTLQGRAGWAHEFTPEDDPVSATLETSPFLLVTGSNTQRLGDYTATGNSAYVGEDWLELGAGVRLDLSRLWSVQVDYEGQFGRDDASAHFAGLKLSYEWGTQFLSALR